MGTLHTTATTGSCLDTALSSAISGWKDEVKHVAGVWTLHKQSMQEQTNLEERTSETKTNELRLCNGNSVVAQHGFKTRKRPKRIPREEAVLVLYCFCAA
jgi:hypothetical protein